MREFAAFLLGLLIIVGGAGYAVAYANKAEEVVQPIRFPHAKHTSLVSCQTCHTQVNDTPHAGLPKIATCMGCHQADVSKSPEAAKVRQYSDRGEEVPWIRLYELADDISFSHRFHLKQGLDCQACHGAIGESTQWNTGFGKNGTNGPSGRDLMGFCLACHQGRGAATDCVACHK
ncbi:MAG: hypothetical protein M1370_10375 [Bacteroidetes bacterium]|nr:hypothetical protein [Bacteroidota bacterium]MCL5025512.1 hypothetical protein [Chloroflexota bacterium]